MGVGGPKPDMKEIDATKASLQDDKFDKIVARIKSVANPEEFSDETHPLYLSIGEDEFETGTQRIVLFNINKFDFELTRNVETHRLSGEGHQKFLEEHKIAKAHIKLRRKSQYDENWQVMDLDELGF